MNKIIKIFSKYIFTLTIFIFVFFTFFVLPTPKVLAATVLTLDASSLATSADLVGVLFLSSTETYTEAFYYGKSTSGVSIGSCSSTSNFSKGTLLRLNTVTGQSVGYDSVVTGLVFNTTYYFWAVGINSSNGKTVCGAQKSFSTYAPDISSANVSSITSNTATLNGTVNAMGTGTYQVSFNWWKSGSGQNSNVVGTVSGTSAKSFSLPLSGLSPSSTYNFQINMFNTSTNKLYSNVTQTFSTPAGSSPPSFALSCTLGAYTSNSDCTSAAIINNNPIPSSITVRSTGTVTFNWSGTTDQSWITISPVSGTVAFNGAGSVQVNINTSGLAAGNYFGNVTITPTSPTGGAPKTMPVFLSIGEPLTIVQSVWSIFKASDLSNAIQALTLLGKPNYTASGLGVGAYTAKLQITNSAEQNATSTKNFNVVTDSIPVASSVTLGAPPDYCVDSTAATITWNYSGATSQSAYQVKLSHTGNFNNPDFDSGKVQSGSSSYIASGLSFNTTYQAQVTVWDSNNNVSTPVSSNSWKTPKHVYPNVDFSWTPSVNPISNQLIQFTDTTQFSDVGGSGQRGWSWLFGDGGSAAIQNPSHTYTIAGLYNVTDNVTDKDGYTCALTKPISIQQPIPVWKEVSPK